MNVRPETHKSEWQKSLRVTIILLLGMILLTFESTAFSDWMPIVFCWGDIVVFSAIPIILFASFANKPFPNFRGLINGLPWALTGAFAFFILYVVIMSNYYAGIELKYDLSFFGILVGIIGFGLGWWFKRRIIIFIAIFILPYFWFSILENYLAVAGLVIVGIVGSIALVSWWNQVSPPSSTTLEE